MALPYLANFFAGGNGLLFSMLTSYMIDEVGCTQQDAAVAFLVMGLSFTLSFPICAYVRTYEATIFNLCFVCTNGPIVLFWPGSLGSSACTTGSDVSATAQLSGRERQSRHRHQLEHRWADQHLAPEPLDTVDLSRDHRDRDPLRPGLERHLHESQEQGPHGRIRQRHHGDRDGHCR